MMAAAIARTSGPGASGGGASFVGPVLAGVTTLALSGTFTALATIVTLAHATGLAVPMFGIMRGGRTLLARVSALVNNLGRLNGPDGTLEQVSIVFGPHFFVVVDAEAMSGELRAGDQHPARSGPRRCQGFTAGRTGLIGTKLGP